MNNVHIAVIAFALIASLCLIIAGIANSNSDAEMYGILGVLATCGYVAYTLTTEEN